MRLIKIGPFLREYSSDVPAIWINEDLITSLTPAGETCTHINLSRAITIEHPNRVQRDFIQVTRNIQLVADGISKGVVS